MNTSIKHIITLILFVGIVVTPTFAFESSPTGELNGSLSETTSGRPPAPYPSKLKKIAAQLSSWDTIRDGLGQSEKLTEASTMEEPVEEDDAEEDTQEIKKLDKVFRDYVMAKFIRRDR
jgi:hypothetical protein